jgi:hypothetical protein
VTNDWQFVLKEHFAPMYKRAGPFEIASGWFDLMLSMSDWIWSIDDQIDRTEFHDIKSKYAELRCDHFSESERVDSIVATFEVISPWCCETCGAPGKVRGKGWLTAACDEHAPAEGGN